jgi:cell division protein FtsW (lipid II flippase)
LGIAILYLIILLLLLYVSTGRPFYVIGGGMLLAIIGGLAYMLYGVARQRFGIWLDPWTTADGSSYQIVQSLIAVGNGGVFGQGIAQGAPVYIPIAHSDFIFAAIGEEWGLFGMLAILIIELILSLRAIRLSISQSQPFRALLSIGIGLTFAIQSALIMAGSLKLIPLTGITLPLVSYGGSSLIISFVLVGLLLVISAEA